MASKARARIRNRPVRIRFNSALGPCWVKSIVCGYVSKPYAQHTDDESQASTYRWWQADRFVNKWISPKLATAYEIVFIPQEPANGNH